MYSPLRSLADVNPSNAYLWAEFRTQFDVNGVRKTENMGRHPLAPRLLTLGDGSTAATIPQQITGRHGLVFTGTQYVDTGIVDVFERTDRFTLFACTSGGTGAVIASTDQAQSYRGIASILLNNSLYIEVFSTYPTNCIYGNALAYPRRCVTSALTYSGNSLVSGTSIYIDAISKTIGSTTDNLNSTIKSGKSFLIGAHHNGAAKATFFTGNIHFAAIFPWEFSAQQVQYLHRLCMTRINAA